MKYIIPVLALAVFCMVGCSDDNPLDVNSESKLAGADAIPKNHPVPYRASWDTRPLEDLPFDECGVLLPDVPPFGLAADGHATHLGNSSWVAVSSTNTPLPAPGEVGVQTGCTIVTAANGDELYQSFPDGSFETVFVDGVPVQFNFWGEVIIDGGTGRFVNATGVGQYEGSFFFDTQTGHMEETGWIQW